MSEAKIIDGEAIAAGLRRRIGEEAATLKARHDLKPGLAVVLVGDNPARPGLRAQQGQAGGKRRAWTSHDHHLPADVTEEALLGLVRGLGDDARVNGIPGAASPAAPHPRLRRARRRRPGQGRGRLPRDQRRPAGHRRRRHHGPCTPLGCLMLLKHHLGELAGLKALVIGRSNIVGKPVAALLLAEHCTVTIAHSRTRDLAGNAAAPTSWWPRWGRARMVGGDWDQTGRHGHRRRHQPHRRRFRQDAAGRRRGFRRGGQGRRRHHPGARRRRPMTIACLLRNTLVAACRQNGIEPPEI